VKNPKDYIQETSPNNQTITSLAYWLTAEGLDNPIYAALLRDAINTSSDEEFAKAFDGATKEEATHFLASWELCYMPLWGAPELSKAIVLSDEGRNEDLALRAILLSQGVGELPDVFTPDIGIKWAMNRGYLIDGSMCTWTGVVSGIFGHPHNQTQSVTGDSPLIQTEKPQLKGMTKLDIAKAFDGVYWSYDKWNTNLADAPKWLEAARVARGSKKLHVSHLWNPVLIALSLMDNPRHIDIKRLDSVFIRLKDWQNEWNEKTELER